MRSFLYWIHEWHQFDEKYNGDANHDDEKNNNLGFVIEWHAMKEWEDQELAI